MFKAPSYAGTGTGTIAKAWSIRCAYSTTDCWLFDGVSLIFMSWNRTSRETIDLGMSKVEARAPIERQSIWKRVRHKKTTTTTFPFILNKANRQRAASCAHSSHDIILINEHLIAFATNTQKKKEMSATRCSVSMARCTTGKLFLWLAYDCFEITSNRFLSSVHNFLSCILHGFFASR